MEIVLKENEWARDMIETHEAGKNIRETLRRVARFYSDSGLKPSAVKKKLMDFLSSCGRNCDTNDRLEMVNAAVRQAAKRPAIEIESVDISYTELEKINALDGKQIRRLAFTLLCVAKYRDISNGQNDHWVCARDKEIMSMANISTSLDRQATLYRELREAQLVQFSKKVDGLGTRVLFVDDGEAVMNIKDFRNLGYQYQMYRGEPYFVCSNCGITMKQSNPDNRRRQKYCAECAVKIRMKQNVDSVMRFRLAKK